MGYSGDIGGILIIMTARIVRFPCHNGRMVEKPNSLSLSLSSWNHGLLTTGGHLEFRNEIALVLRVARDGRLTGNFFTGPHYKAPSSWEAPRQIHVAAHAGRYCFRIPLHQLRVGH